ncbi:peroxiredoxin family protein [Thalassomonas haliotis]|uniref:thioredoxin-dependent peroxiredoxin n=1 Tax=Thalassomonas haliotis TaxID=485448 RepID=A0ABY7VFN9_9GAMM|nr:peroxiredoxin family protein [Thalassomonas haliotis]WDE12202.1 AhpC/TSA family protein [Thalassomonas haliotis]
MKLIYKLLTAGLAVLFTFTAQATKPIAEQAAMVSPLLNGQQIPAVMATTVEGKQINLQDVLAGKKTILFFYRGGWCPFCNTQMGQLKKISGRLQGMGFQLIGISTDAPEGLKASIKERDLDYTLLSDFNSKVSQSFGLAFFASQKTTERYVSKMNLGNPLQKNSQGQERLVLPAPAVYVFDAKGLVQFNYVNPNFRVRLDEELLLKAAELVR